MTSPLFHPNERVLIDAAANVVSDPILNELGNDGKPGIRFERLRGGKQDGIDRVLCSNGVLCLDILTTRGMSIASVGCGGEPMASPALRLGWDSPTRGPVHPSLVPLGEPSGLGWLEGFSEWFIRCGLESNGAPEWDDAGRLAYPLHGRIANTPAHRVVSYLDREGGAIVVAGQMRESRLFFANWELTTIYRLPLGEPRLEVIDVVTNLATEPRDFELLYHINTGAPLAEPGATMRVPFVQMAPRTPAAAAAQSSWLDVLNPAPGSEENVYFVEPAADTSEEQRATVMLTSADRQRGVSVSFSKKELPCFSLWKSHRPDHDGYVVGLEPATNFPNPRSVEKGHGRTVVLKPKESYTTHLTIDALLTPNAVEAMVKRIDQLQQKTQGMVWPMLPPIWT